jgi:hypothetical protein
LFEDVIACVAEMHQTTWFPLILSLEVHCTEKVQNRMVEILSAYLGDRIYVSKEPLAVLPSPNELKGKVSRDKYYVAF